MGEAKDNKIVIEEQKILDELINEMDKNIKNKNDKLKGFIEEARRSKGGNTDVSSSIGITQQRKSELIQDIKRAEKTRDELYHHRIKVHMEDQDGYDDDEEYKIGLHTYATDAKIYVMSWKREIARHYLMGNPSVVFEYDTTLKHGDKFRTKCTLIQKRKVDLRFTNVKNATQLFPIVSAAAEKVIADEFLQELLERRSNVEFQNIVFSIQKQQGEIIQAPFRQNMIVQGCAGSGKSMIMLHRLPILMYDNPNALNKANLYIITPSQTYIQMANNMRHQLEIEDLSMGTINQYFDYCIEKYGRKPDDYGKPDPFILLEQEKENYVYSTECKNYIIQAIEDDISTESIDLKTGFSTFSIQERKEAVSTPFEFASQFMMNLQNIIKANDDIMKKYFGGIKQSVTELEEMQSMLRNRKNNALREYTKQRTKQDMIITKAQKEIDKLDPVDNALAIQNRKDIIEEAKNEIEKIKAQIVDIEQKTEYFADLEKISNMIEDMCSLYHEMEKDYEKNKFSNIYKFIRYIPDFIDKYYYVFYELDSTEDLYDNILESLDEKKNMINRVMETLESIEDKYLDESYYADLRQTRKDWGDPMVDVPVRIYQAILLNLGIETDDDKIPAFNFSAYVYLQILFQYRGRPKAGIESLITIDEAQGISREELLLIKHLNDDRVILNLFGDEKQHIEGTKGLDSWSEVEDIVDFKMHTMVDNYRNAKQITNPELFMIIHSIAAKAA